MKIWRLVLVAAWFAVMGSLLVIMAWNMAWQRAVSFIVFSIFLMLAMPWMSSKFHRLMRPPTTLSPDSAVAYGPIKLTQLQEDHLIGSTAVVIQQAINSGEPIDADALAVQIVTEITMYLNLIRHLRDPRQTSGR